MSNEKSYPTALSKHKPDVFKLLKNLDDLSQKYGAIEKNYETLKSRLNILDSSLEPYKLEDEDKKRLCPTWPKCSSLCSANTRLRFCETVSKCTPVVSSQSHFQCSSSKWSSSQGSSPQCAVSTPCIPFHHQPCKLLPSSCSPCASCGSPYTSDGIVGELQKDLEQWLAHTRQLKQEKCLAETRILQLEMESRRLQEKETQIHYLEEEIITLKDDIAKLKSVETERDRLKEKFAALERLTVIYDDLKEMSNKYDAVKEERDGLTRKVQASCQLESEFRKLKMKESEAQFFKCERCALQGELDRVLASKEKIQKDIEKVLEKIKGMKQMYKEYAELGDAMTLSFRLRKLTMLFEDCRCLKEKIHQNCRQEQ